MKSKLNLLKEFATRIKTGDYEKIYSILPDPDKLLIENNYDYSIYRDLLTDPHLMATIQQRKMQVAQMGWQIEHEGDPKVKEKVIEIFRQLSLGEIISNILDAIFFGFSVGEIIWRMEGNEIIPIDIIGKPQEWFIFTKDNELRLRKYVNGSYVFEEGEKLPEYKFILTQYQPTYINPYGEKVLSRVYWPVTFKRRGIEFWQLMMEKYGMPYLIGKYPNSFTQEQKDEFLEQLEQMVEDNVTIFEDTLGIELKESPQYDIGQLYEILVNFHNKEILKAVLTVTLTTEIEKVGSYKASEIHKEMLSYVGVTDKKLVEKALNTLIQYYCFLNYGKIDTPRVKLQKKESVVEESAERDKILSDIGVKFTKEYFKKRYNLSEVDFDLEV
jgi:phage gp29-like protein